MEYNAHKKQQFYFAELSRDRRSCTKPGVVYQELTRPRSWTNSLNEYEFQEENHVVSLLDEHLHTTYSYWPSLYEAKSSIKMSFFQKPIYNYRLKCELDPNKTMDTLLESIEN